MWIYNLGRKAQLDLQKRTSYRFQPKEVDMEKRGWVTVWTDMASIA